MERSSDMELAQEAEEFEALVASPGWARLEKIADAKLEAIQKALLQVDPNNPAQIASLQSQARESGYFFGLVKERIAKGREARQRLLRSDNRG